MILVFGGNGFIGQHVARYLIQQGEQIVVTSHSRASSLNPKLVNREFAMTCWTNIEFCLASVLEIVPLLVQFPETLS